MGSFEFKRRPICSERSERALSSGGRDAVASLNCRPFSSPLFLDPRSPLAAARHHFRSPVRDARPGPMWGDEAWDSLDYGLELDLDNETTCSIIRKQHRHNEGLLVYEGLLKPSELLADAGDFRDVTERWRALGPQSIFNVTTVWTRHGFGPVLDSTGRHVATAGQSDLPRTASQFSFRSLTRRAAVLLSGDSDAIT